MAKIWVNPAFKDKVTSQLTTKEESKTSRSGGKSEKKEKVKKKKPKKQQKKPSDPEGVFSNAEYKLFQHLMVNQIRVEIKFIGGRKKITGKIKWFSHMMMGFETDKKKNLIFNKMRLIYYRPFEEIKHSEIKSLFWLELKENISEKLADKIPSEKLISLKTLINKTFTQEKLTETLNELKFIEEEIEEILKQAEKITSFTGTSEIVEFQKLKDNKIPLIFHTVDNKKIKGILQWYEKLVYNIRSLDEKEEYNIVRSSVVYIEEA